MKPWLQKCAALGVVGLLLFVAQPARAGVITFNALTTTISFTFDQTGDPTTRSVTVSACPLGEICNINLSAPVGYTLGATTLPATLWVGQDFATANGTFIADTLQTTISGGNSANYRFVSDIGPPNLGTCGSATPCTIGENGQIQVFGTVTWIKAGSPSVTDTIRFASAVPEPMTSALSLVWLGLIGFAKRSRRRIGFAR
jgi:hypothetical protein